MVRYYHERFFSDTRFTTVVVLALFGLGFSGVSEAFLLVPVVALLGANQTAFDASYLYFARHYAHRLEQEVNGATKRRILVAAELEDAYLFPLSRRKIVTVGYGPNFSWFGWMTMLYTVLGILAFAAGLGLGWSTLASAGIGWTAFYLGSLTSLTLGSLVAGWWWFVAGVGERRLAEVLDGSFGARVVRDNVRPIGG